MVNPHFLHRCAFFVSVILFPLRDKSIVPQWFFEKRMYKIIKNITFGNVFIVDSLEDFVGEGKGTEKVLTF